MNKTVSISLSGQVFQIDEFAYETLKSYLENIRRRFATAEGGQEIIADIESRIAELFLEKLNDRKQVITPADVEAMMQAMGKPEDFETPAGETGYGQATTTAEPTRGGARRLFRDPDEKVLGGVCSGLSAYFGINDPIWMRLLFIISPFLTVGTALLIYIILWIIIPEAKTSSEKLQMRGEHVNISSIEKTIREDLNDLGNKFNDISNGSAGAKVKGFLHEVIDVTVKVIRVLLNIIGKLLGVVLVIAGMSIIVGIIIALFLPPEMTNIDVKALYPAIFASEWQFLMVALGLVLVVVVPAIGIALTGFHLLIKTRRRIKGVGLAMTALIILGVILLSYFITRTVVDFQETQIVRDELRLEQPTRDTLALEGFSTKAEGEGEYELPGIGKFMETDSQLIFTNNVKLDIKKSASGNYELVRTYKASGRKLVYAERRASNISHAFEQNGDVLTFDANISVPKEDHYREQEVALLLKVPEGKSVFLAESVKDILYDVKNTHDMYDGDMVGHTWIMLPEGLTCMDCTPQEIIEGSINQPVEGGINRKLDYKDFSAIDVHGAVNLVVKQGEFSVSASGKEDFMDNAKIAQDGSVLSIRMEGRRSWMRERGTVTVTLPELKEIEVGGTAHVTISGFHQERMSMEVKGASKVDLKSSVVELDLEEGGASTVTLSGTGNGLTAEVSGSSELRAFDYEVQRGTVEVSGASDAEINVQKEMTVEASGASKIRYKGLPKISSDVTGYSSIKPERQAE